MFEQTLKNIDDVLWKEAGCSSELDYTEQISWLLFLNYLDDLDHERAQPPWSDSLDRSRLLILCSRNSCAQFPRRVNVGFPERRVPPTDPSLLRRASFPLLSRHPRCPIL